MKVVFQAPIADRIYEAIAEAKRGFDTIDYILLDQNEWLELRAFIDESPRFDLGSQQYKDRVDYEISFAGTWIKREKSS